MKQLISELGVAANRRHIEKCNKRSLDETIPFYPPRGFECGNKRILARLLEKLSSVKTVIVVRENKRNRIEWKKKKENIK